MRETTTQLRQAQRRLGLVIASSGITAVAQNMKNAETAIVSAVREGRLEKAQAFLESLENFQKSYNELRKSIKESEATKDVSTYARKYHQLASEIAELGERFLPLLGTPEEE